MAFFPLPHVLHFLSTHTRHQHTDLLTDRLARLLLSHTLHTLHNTNNTNTDPRLLLKGLSVPLRAAPHHTNTSRNQRLPPLVTLPQTYTPR